MKLSTPRLVLQAWSRIGTRWLPFADAATREFPLGRLLRLSLFQVSVGMVIVLTNGTLNRVMIVELGASAALVALMLAIPVLIAPLRVLIGHRSDHHRSALGWRRVPYLWMGTMLQFGGLAIMPFALLVLSGTGQGPVWAGQLGALLAFLLVCGGTHIAQTAGLALATDLAPEESRPRVVALLYVTLLLGMVGCATVFGWLLADYTPLRLVQVIQGAAMLAVALNIVALWKQEARDPARTRRGAVAPSLAQAWNGFVARPGARRMLFALGAGTLGFGMQDVLLEPYGGEVLGMSVGQTTALTGLMAGGTLLALWLAARMLARGVDPARVSALGALIGIGGFSAVVLSGALDSPAVFRPGTALIGIGAGFFAVGLMVETMRIASEVGSGIALGAWGAVQAGAAGLAIAAGGLIRDLVATLGASGALGPVFENPQAAYGVVWHLEIALLFAALVAIGPLARYRRHDPAAPGTQRLSFAEFPS